MKIIQIAHSPRGLIALGDDGSLWLAVDLHSHVEADGTKMKATWLAISPPQVAPVPDLDTPDACHKPRPCSHRGTRFKDPVSGDTICVDCGKPVASPY